MTVRGTTNHTLLAALITVESLAIVTSLFVPRVPTAALVRPSSSVHLSTLRVRAESPVRLVTIDGKSPTTRTMVSSTVSSVPPTPPVEIPRVMRKIIYVKDDDDDDPASPSASNGRADRTGIPVTHVGVRMITDSPVPTLTRVPTTRHSGRSWNPFSSSWYSSSPPVPPQRQLLVRVYAAGVNPVDAKGVIGDKVPSSWTTLHGAIRKYVLSQRTPGFDFAGVVVATDSDDDHQGTPSPSLSSDVSHAAPRYRVGDEVYGTVPPLTGSFAEYVIAPVDQIAHKPSSLGWTHAAALPLVGLTALQALQPHLSSSALATTATGPTTTPPSPPKRSSVLIIGASGGVGHVALQVARNLLWDAAATETATGNNVAAKPSVSNPMGASWHVTAVCSTANGPFCRDRGATHVIHYDSGTSPDHNPDDTIPYVDRLRARFREAPGCPFDVVLDCVTSADPRDTSHWHYPSFLQDASTVGTDQDPHAASPTSLLSPHFVYRRIGGPSFDWVRAGAERVLGLRLAAACGCGWPARPPLQGDERLFWIQFPASAPALRRLSEWANAGRLAPVVSTVFPFTADGVRAAFDALESRRVRGKLVIQLVEGD